MLYNISDKLLQGGLLRFPSPGIVPGAAHSLHLAGSPARDPFGDLQQGREPQLWTQRRHRVRVDCGQRRPTPCVSGEDCHPEDERTASASRASSGPSGIATSRPRSGWQGFVTRDRSEGGEPGSRWLRHSGFAVNSDRKLDADDRPGIERLLSYMERPAVSLRRLNYRDDGLVHYQGKFHPRLRTDHQLVTPVEFLAMLVPHVALKYEVTLRSYGAISTTFRKRAGWLQHPPTDDPPRLAIASPPGASEPEPPPPPPPSTPPSPPAQDPPPAPTTTRTPSSSATASAAGPSSSPRPGRMTPASAGTAANA